MKTDLQIAKESKTLPIKEIAKSLDIAEDELIFYGSNKAKIDNNALKRVASNKDGNLILVTAINPTPAGEGKTTTSIGLADSLKAIGKKTCLALREPSLGPVFGVKGGACGGGYAQVMPMEDINLHFTGDLHAITAANNLLCAIVDNHIYHGNELNIDKNNILVRRCLDMNDRALRYDIVGMEPFYKSNGENDVNARKESFTISVASEVMASFCLSKNLTDLKEKLGNILVAYTEDKKPIYARDLKASGAMAVLLKEAIKPNLCCTLENTPALIHGGPFANIAHGANSIIATNLALKLADFVVTEAGFGADLGAEKFFDIVCRKANFNVSCVVLVATIRALKYNGGVAKEDLGNENLDALEQGSKNLLAHIENLKKFNQNPIVALNRFSSDTDAEINLIRQICEKENCTLVLNETFALGSKGGKELAEAVVKRCEENKNSKNAPIYDENDSIKEKIAKIATTIYGAKEIDYTETAQKAIENIEALNRDKFSICIAKTQYSLSDNPKLLGAPKDFTITVSDLKLSNGAGFIVVLLGSIMQMPGLPKQPAANFIDIDENEEVIGLF